MENRELTENDVKTKITHPENIKLKLKLSLLAPLNTGDLANHLIANNIKRSDGSSYTRKAVENKLASVMYDRLFAHQVNDFIRMKIVFAATVKNKGTYTFQFYQKWLDEVYYKHKDKFTSRQLTDEDFYGDD